MAMFNLQRRLAAEFLGTALLVATVVGSGIMMPDPTTVATRSAVPRNSAAKRR